jgi:hypothetical protein
MDDPPPLVLGAGGDQDELRPPSHLAITLEVEASIGLAPEGLHLTSLPIDTGIAGVCSIEGRDHLAVRVQQPAEVRLRPRSGSVGVQKAERACLFGCDPAVQRGDPSDDVRVAQVPVWDALRAFGHRAAFNDVGFTLMDWHGLELYLMTSRDGLPDQLDIEVKGRRHPRVEAHLDGCTYLICRALWTASSRGREVDVLHLGVQLEGVHPHLPANTAPLEPAERRL